MESTGSHVRRTNEQRRGTTDWVERHAIYNRLEDHKHFDDRHEYFDPAWSSNRLLPNTIVANELVVHGYRFSDITVPHPDHRWPPELGTRLFIPEIDTEKGPFPHFILDWVKTVKCLGISVQSEIDGKCD